MASFPVLNVSQRSAANLNSKTFQITAQVEEGGVIVGDYTGENALDFPAVLSTLSDDDLTYLLTEPGISGSNSFAAMVALAKAGVLR